MKLPQDLEFGRESEFWLQELLYPETCSVGQKLEVITCTVYVAIPHPFEGWWCINGHVGAVIYNYVCFEVFKTSTRDVAGTYIYRLWKAHDEY